jgi:hypothetical protein
MLRTTLAAAAALAALVVAGTAGAAETEVSGPLTLVGKGRFGGQLEMATPDASRPVVIAGRRFHVAVLDLAGDLKVRCSGRTATSRTERGTLVVCHAQRGQLRIRGSKFGLRGIAGQYLIHLPEGTAGTLTGRFRERAAQDGAAERGRPAPERR